MRCFVGLGSNQGDPVAQVRHALAMLAEEPGLSVVRVSRLYQSAPWGVRRQPSFVNAVAELAVELAPLDVLNRLQAIEARMGRTRAGQRWGPRRIDIDILLIDERILVLPNLVVPHPRMHRRRFVLEPLSELEPDLNIPGRGDLSLFLKRVADQVVAPLPPDGKL